MKNINVAILGATGMVGQRFIQLLLGHPYFRIVSLMASRELAGRAYGDVCNWFISSQMPKEIRTMEVKEADPESAAADGAEIVFSAVPAAVAKELEPRFAEAGFAVFSNASAFRMEDDVPLMMAEVNSGQFGLIKEQRKRRNWKGFIITNPNCSTIVLTMVLKPLLDEFGIKKVVVSTMQAVSGAGYPGVPSLDIIDNVLPYIEGEEKKMETEPLKILGRNFEISASCHRVSTSDSHLEDLHISLQKAASLEEIKKVLSNFGSNFKGLPNSPERLIVVREEPNRPQPRLDRLSGKGMSVTAGRVREDPALENGIKMVILGHNTIRGAAGQSILNAEWWTENARHLEQKKPF